MSIMISFVLHIYHNNTNYKNILVFPKGNKFNSRIISTSGLGLWDVGRLRECGKNGKGWTGVRWSATPLPGWVHLGPLSLVSGASPLFPHLQNGNNNTHCVAENRPFNLSFLLSKMGPKNTHFAGLLRRLNVLNSKYLTPCSKSLLLYKHK